jgi:tetratricopeptide (TPR) repeat protein
MIVAWRSGSQQGVCRMGTMALGGLFLNTAEPPTKGSMLELLFEVSTGMQVRARAAVCNSMPGKGMGVKFVHMRGEDRSRLNQFLKTQIEAGNLQEEFFPEETKAGAGEVPAQDATPSSASAAGSASRQTTASTQEPAANSSATSEPGRQTNEQEDGSVTGEPAIHEQATGEARAGTEEAARADEISGRELQRYLSLSEKSNHYQLLGVTSDASGRDIKKGFYALARKFHPDRHMDRPEWAAPLQKLMGAITEAHNILSDEKKRGAYDRKLIHRQSESQETVEECMKLAANCQRDENIAGAIFWLRKCVSHAPEVAKYRVSLAACMATMPYLRREAAEHFEKAIELDQWNAGAYLQFGELYEMMKLPWRAEPLYSKILEIDPGHVLARQRLARVRGKNKKTSAPLAGIFSKKS